MDWLAPPIALALRSWRSWSGERSTTDQSIGSHHLEPGARITSVPVIDTMSICCAFASCMARNLAHEYGSWYCIGMPTAL